MKWTPGARVDTPCDEWTGAKNSTGYGVWKGPRPERVQMLVHRLVWMQTHGHTDDVILHLCDNPACIRLDHLRAGTQADNVRDRDAKGRNGYSSRVTCKRGHPFTPENTYAIPSGGRACRECQRARSRAFDMRRRRSRLYGAALAVWDDDD